MIKQENVYKIGKIGKPHGVNGEVGFMFDDDVFDRTDIDFLILEIDGILVPFFIDEYRFRGSNTALVKFCDIRTQEAARELTGCDVFFLRELADNDEDTLSWAQIIGFNIIDNNTGNSVGEIKSVDNGTINTLFEVSAEDGKQFLIPASEELITEVNTADREIRVNLPQGILDI